MTFFFGHEKDQSFSTVFCDDFVRRLEVLANANPGNSDFFTLESIALGCCIFHFLWSSERVEQFSEFLTRSDPPLRRIADDSDSFLYLF
jgi:hypothetical protein